MVQLPLEKGLAVSNKKHTSALLLSSSNPSIYPRENICSQKDLYATIHSDFIHCSPKLDIV